ncbi:YceI family protein [Cupriavidus campinensis]|uniref:YceI family protein n=1 Tax=Cupriavidus campinensis TaxID=151783 RepID=UPI0011EDCAD9|nr:YceI family protein [Cupriavidus campinensis]
MLPRLLIAALLGASAPIWAAPVNYNVDPTHTAVYFGASHFDRTTVRGRFNKLDGRILYDPATGMGSIDFTVDTDSVDTGNRSLDGVLRSPQFFDSQNFPVARFQGNRFVVEGGKLVAVEGQVSLLGVTHPLRLEADRFSCGRVVLFGVGRDVCGGDFHASLPRSAFGMTRFLPDVGDTVTLHIAVEATPAQ